jgi:uncharacterized repeat protein (TIGR03803 family)
VNILHHFHTALRKIRFTDLCRVSVSPMGLFKAGLAGRAFALVGLFTILSAGRLLAAVPAITSAATATGKVGVAFSYQITASNAPTSFGATGLPAGLTISTTTGLISGTPTAAGASTVTLSATNAGGTGTKTLTLTINPPTPVITSVLTATGKVGVAFSYQITATNAPASFGATGLPAGLTVSTTTGLISGTPTAAGTTSVTIKATNAGGTGTATLSLTINPATPVISSAATATGKVGVAFSYQITASSAPTSFGATGLPAGVTVNTTTGLISGTPTTAAVSTVTLSATNAGGTGTKTLTLTINPPTPVITSVLTATGQVGVAFSYQITATNAPASFGATGLPAGLAVSATTGLISGTPTVAGTKSVTLSATNAGGTGTATLTLTINPATPVISSAATATGKVGVAFSYQITASNAPTSFGATGLPAGLTVSTTTGLISGTPTAAGVSTVTLSATNAGGTGTKTLTLTINPPTPAITSVLAATGQVGVAFSYQITASNAPASFGATGLPAGLTVSATTGLISGTPTAAGTKSVTLSATNAGGTGTATLTLTINPATPVISSAATATGKVGVAFSYQITASNAPTSFGATGLPAGVTVNTTTGLISGTPTAAGVSTVTLSATNAGGTGTKTLTLTINPPTPAITSVLTATGQVGVAFSYQITASNSPTSFGATGLPAGLTVSTATGLISGTPTAAGTKSVTLSATNAGGTGTAVLTLTIAAPSKPVITSSLTATGQLGVAFSYQITASNVPTSFGATGLPAGLTVNTTTGLISGTPTAAGTKSVTLSATNAGGTGTAVLTLTITASSKPVITSPLTAIGQVGVVFNYQITASNAPSSFGATGLPAGVTVNTTTGVISGTPATAAVSTVTLTATNTGGTGSAVLTLTINPPTPMITSPLTATGQVGVAFNYQITASNAPTSFGATGLPAGVTVNTTTGVISGTPTTAAVSTVTLTATNAGGTGSAVLTLTIYPPTPVITSPLTATGQVGVAFSYQITASNAPASFGATSLPAGLTVDTTAGIISGTPTAPSGGTVTLTATNAGGTGSAGLNLTINPPTPVITNATTATGQVGVAFSFQITASNSPTSFGATGLPDGLTVDTTAGLISGTPTTAAVSTVTLTATNAGGTGSAGLNLTINPPTPVITSILTATGLVGVPFSYQIVASNAPTSFGATGLPAGLAIDSTTGIISGTPTTAAVSAITLSATNAGGTGTAVLNLTISPLPTATVSSGLQAWYRADLGVAKDANNNVSEMADLSGNGYHLVQTADSTRQPQWVAGAMNGQPALQFNFNAYDVLQTSAPENLLAGSNDMTVFVVEEPALSPNPNNLAAILNWGSDGNGNYGLTGDGGTNQYLFYWDDASGNGTRSPVMNTTAWPVQILSMTKGGTSASSYVNGAWVGTSVVPAALKPAVSQLALGNAVGELYYGFNGQIAEVLVYNRALSDAERQQVESQLETKYINPDSNGNGIPDSWEMKYLGTLQYGANDDPGGVGRTLLQSYQQGLSPWPSASVSSGLQTWYRADLGVTKDASNNVSQWADLSGNGYHVEQTAVPTQQPQWVAGAVNGQPAVQFVPGNENLQTYSPVNLLAGSNDITMMAVVQSPASQSMSGTIFNFGSDGNLPYGLGASGLNQFMLGLDDPNGNEFRSPPLNAQSGPAQVLSVVKGGTSASSYVNGVWQGTDNMPAVLRAVVSPLAVGNQIYPYYAFNGQIAEILVYNRALSDAERQQVESQLETKYINPDSNGNGIPDAWEMKNLGTLQYGANDDPGGVGRTLLQSYQQGLSPWPAPAVSNGLQAWYRADLGVTQDANNNVSQWADLSGNGYHVEQTAVPTQQPQWSLSALNGQPAVQFVPGTDYLQTYNPVDLLAGSNDMTVIAVVEPQAMQGTNATIFNFGSDGNLPYGLTSGGDNKYFLGLDDPSGNEFRSPAINTPPGQAQMLTIIKGGATASSYLNGALQGIGTMPTMLQTVVSPLTVGNQDYPYYAFNGQIAEILVYNRALTDAERGQIETTLGQKYSIAIAPSAPVFSSSAGTYSTAQWVTITSTGSTSIYYTTDGSTPTTSSTLYTGAISVSTTTTLKAIGVDPIGSSPVANGTYTINIPPQIIPQWQFSLLHAFTGVNEGVSPYGNLIQGTDGRLYGTTDGAYGTVFAVNTDGTGLVTLHAFSNGADGANPGPCLVQGTDGRLYGTTGSGGGKNWGTLFAVNSDGTGFTILYTFTGLNDAGNPGNLILGTDGRLYGTAYEGAAAYSGSWGTVFAINPDGTGFATLYSFRFSNTGYASPTSLIQGVDGRLYGTAGGIFAMNTDGTGFATISRLTGNDLLATSIMQGIDGRLYGTTGPAGEGDNLATIFAVNTDGTGFVTLQNIATPYLTLNRLIQGTDGLLYGSSYNLGAKNDGAVFTMNPDGTGFTILYSFTDGNDGGNPGGRLLQGSDGRLYGMAVDGGANGHGTLFALSKLTSQTVLAGTGATFTVTAIGTGPLSYQWQLNGVNIAGATGTTLTFTNINPSDAGSYTAVVSNAYGSATSPATTLTVTLPPPPTIISQPQLISFSVLHGFNGYSDGGNLQAGLIRGSNGRLYGTSISGGPVGYGTVFAVNPDGSGFATLHSFNGTDGAQPTAGLIQGTDGRLYGMTSSGGVATGSGYGTLFAVNPDGSGFTTLYVFTDGTDGGNPSGSLIQGTDGRLYGTSVGGGANGLGALFAINADGTGFTTFYSFTNGTDGASPNAGLILGTDGRFYGTTGGGGASGGGVVFAISPDGTGFTTLYSFGWNDGSSPNGGLIQRSDGRLYGATYQGGLHGVGTLFAVNPDGTGFATLHNFTNGNDGSYPLAGLIQGTDGRLYGTAGSGGDANGNGIVFAISPDGTGFTTLYRFTGGNDGSNPRAGLIQGVDGQFYGTAASGGANGAGTIFAISLQSAIAGTNATISVMATGAGPLTYQWQLNGVNINGATAAALTLNNITASNAGSYTVVVSNPGGSVTSTATTLTVTNLPPPVFTPAAGTYTAVQSVNITSLGATSIYYTIDGSTPTTASTLYTGAIPVSVNTTLEAIGVNSSATSTVTSGSYTIDVPPQIVSQPGLSLLHGFTGGNDGSYPNGSLVQGTDGRLYGTTSGGGDPTGDGTVFAVNPDGTGYTTLYRFTGGNDGSQPQAGLIQGTDERFYGTTPNGGANGYGTVFAINPDGTGFATLYSFAGGSDGTSPYDSLIQGTDGRLYGTASGGGANNFGTVFAINPDGTAYATLYSFTGGNDGGYPRGAVIQGTDGRLYGTTWLGGTAGIGILYAVNPDGTGFTTLYSFTGGNDGAYPSDSLMQGADGQLYGTSPRGGINSNGTLFAVNPDGTNFTTLYLFTGGNDGAIPAGSLIRGSDGRLYATTETGGTNQNGVVFAINPDGTGFATLYSFTGGNDGGSPNGSLIQGTDGRLYGTANSGGDANGDGTVFAISSPVVTLGSSAVFSVTATGSPTPTYQWYFNGNPISGATSATLTLTNVNASNAGSYTVVVSNAYGSVTSNAALLTIPLPPSAPVFNPPAGTYTSGLSVTITSSGADNIYYTTDGSTPTASSTLYSDPISISTTTTLSAIGVNTKGSSPVTSGIYTINLNPPAPVISSAATATGQVGAAFSYQIVASNSPTSFAATGLPAGLTVDPVAGLISGTPTAPGVSTVTLSAANAGGTGTATLTLTVNPSIPVINITSPASFTNPVNSTTLPIIGTVTDPSAVTLTINGTAVPLGAGGAFNWPQPLPLEGANQITLSAQNVFGKTTTLTYTVYRITQAPSLTITSPATDPFSTRFSSLQVTGTVGSSATQLLVNSIPVANFSTGTFSQSVTLVPGNNTITVRVQDALGNSRTVQHTVILDQTPPTFTNLTPQNGFLTNSLNLTVAGTVVNGQTLTINGQNVALSSTGAFSTTVTLAEGATVITLQAQDALGNSAVQTISGTLDTVAPVVVINSPLPGTTVTTSLVTVSGTVDDPAAALTLNGSPLANNNGTFSTTVSLTAGQTTLAVQAHDAAGNVGSKSVTISLDSTPPVVAFTAPANGSATRTATVQVTGTVDNPADTITVNGFPAAVSAGKFVLSNFALKDGPNVLTAVATDPFGLTSSVSITVNLDRTPPAMPVLTNPPTYVKTDRVTLAGTAQPGSTVNIEGGLIAVSTTADPTTGAFSATVLLTPNKTTNLFLTATDSLGNTSDTLVQTVVSDTIPPVITLTHPANGASLNASVFEVDGTVVDANPPSTITVNGQTVPLLANGVFGCNVTLPVGPASQNIVVIAVDLAGNQTTLTSPVTIASATNNNPPSIVILSPASYATVPTANITVTAIVTDALPLASITANGNPVTGPDANGMITANVTVDSSGQFTVTAADANNTTTVTGHVVVNGNAPAAPTIQQVSATSPTSDTQIILYASAQPSLAYQITGGLIANQTGTVGADGKIVATVPLTLNTTNNLQLTVIGPNGLSSPPASVVMVQDSAPTVLQTTPAALATGVAPNTTIQIVFSKAVSSTGLSAIQVSAGGSPVTCTPSLSSDQTTVTLTPPASFTGSTSVQVTVPATVSDLAQTPLGSAYTFSFTTATTAAPPSPDIVTPTATTNKTNSTALTITGTAQALSTITVTGAAVTPVTAQTGANGNFSVNVTLTPNTSNTLQVTATDAFGNVSPPATVTITHDNQPFVLQSSVPANGATAVAAGTTPIVLTFNKAVDPTTLTGVNLVGSGIVATTVSASGTTVSLAPTAALQPGTTYTLVIPSGVADLFGNRFGTTQHLSFTTAASTTVAVPIVYTAQPTGATNLTSATITGYSNPGTTLLISGGASSFTGPTIDTTGLFTVTVPLQSNANNQIVLVAQDAQGNQSAPVNALNVRQDSVAPTVVSTTPADGAIGVDPHASLFVQFSKAVQAAPLSATIPAIRLFDNQDVVVAGSWALSPDGLGATFYPAIDLAAGARYKLLIDTSVRDLAGNPLAADVPAIFVTAASTAITKPAAPVLNPLPSPSTTSQTVTLTGTAVAGADVRIFGGQAEQDVTADAQGNFTTTINLVPNSTDQLALTSEVGGADSSFTTTTIKQLAHPTGIRILSPQPNLEYNNASVTVAGVIDNPAAVSSIMVDGHPAVIAGRHFYCQDILDPSPGAKTVTAVATLNDNSTVTQSVSFTLNIEDPTAETKAPIPCFIFPEPNDVLPGDVVEAVVTVEEGVQLSSVDIAGVTSHAYFGNIFFIYAQLPQQGPNIITVNATSAAGFVGHASVTVMRQMNTFTSAPTVNPVATGSWTDKPIVTLTGTADPGSIVVVMNGLVPVRTVAAADGTYSVVVPLNPNASNHLQVEEADSAGNVSPASTVDIAEDDTPPVIVSTSPSAGDTSVAQNASIQVVFSKPINPASIAGAVALQSQLGQTISHNDQLSADGKTLTIVPTYKFLRGDTITVNIAATIADPHGFPLGSADSFSFTTAAYQTTVSGIVIDPQLQPLANVKVGIVGSNVVQYTSSFGTFILDNPPVGDQILYVDARPDPVTGVTPQGDARIFGYLEYALPINANVDNSLGHPIFMVDTDESTASQFATTGTGNVLTFNSTRNDLSGFSIIYNGGSTHFADGTNHGSVTATLIDPEDIPDRLPSGAIPHFMVEIGPDELTFDTPAALTFPNVYQLAPGAQVIVFQFRYGVHNYVELGRATVAADGTITTGPMLTEGGFLGIVPADPSFDLAHNILEGRVVDASGNGLAGVSVNAIAEDTYVTTDANGNYSITLPDVRIALIRTIATISTDFGAAGGGSPSLVFPSALVNLQASGVTKMPDIVVNSFVLGGSIRYIDANGDRISNLQQLAYNQGQLVSLDNATVHGVEIFVYRRTSAAGDLPVYDSTPYLRTTASLNPWDSTYDSGYTLPFLGSLDASSSGTPAAASTIPSPGDVVKVVAFDPATGFYGETDLTIPPASEANGTTDLLDVTVNLELRPPLLTLDMNRVFFLNGIGCRADIPNNGIAFTSDQYVEFKTTWTTPEVTPLDRPELALSGRLRAISINYQNDYNFVVRAGEQFRVLELREGIFPGRLSVLQQNTDVGTETVSVSPDGSFAPTSLVPINITTSAYGLAAASTQVTDTTPKQNVLLNILNLQLTSDPNGGIDVSGQTLPTNPVGVAGSTLTADGKGNFSGVVSGDLGAGGVPVSVGNSLATLYGQALTPVINALNVTPPGLVPSTGSIGDHIVINGANFSPVASDDQVSFNGAAAAVVAASETQLTVVVPSLASSGNVTVTVGGNQSNGVLFEFLSVGINNGSFEDGTFRAWTLQGSGNIIQNWKQVAPTDGQYMAFLDTMSDPRDGVATLTSDPFVVPLGMQTLLFDYYFASTALFQPVGNVLQFQIVTDTETIQVPDLFANVSQDVNLPLSGFDQGSGFSTASLDVSSWAGTGQTIQVRLILNGRGPLPTVIPGMNQDDGDPMDLSAYQGTGLFLDNFRLSAGLDTTPLPLDPNTITTTSDGTNATLTAPASTLPQGSRVYIWTLSSGQLNTIDIGADGGFTLVAPFDDGASAAYYMISYATPDGGVGRLFSPEIKVGVNR